VEFPPPKRLEVVVLVANGDGFVVVADAPNIEGAAADPNGDALPLPKGTGAEPNGAGEGAADRNGDGFEENVDCCGVPNGVLPEGAEPKGDNVACVPKADVGAPKGLVCC
jgi:hypothetical protein